MNVKMGRVKQGVLLAIVLALATYQTSAHAEEAAKSITPLDGVGQDYCASFANLAAEQRIAVQKEELTTMRADIDAQLLKFQAKSEELSKLITEHNAILDRATRDIIKIYASVDAEAAAQQLREIEPETAGAILRKLSAKRSGEILSVMDLKAATPILRSLSKPISDKPEGKS